MEDKKIVGCAELQGGEFNKLTISGSVESNKDIKANIMKVSGAFECNGSIDAKELNISGACEIASDVRFESANISGAVEVNGNMEGEVLTISGSIEVEGDINVDKLDIRTNKSELNNVYGNDIFIASKTSTIVNEIAATNIDINNVKCNKVSGDSVVIGPFTKVDVVEFKNTLSIDEKSKIGKVVKIQ